MTQVNDPTVTPTSYMNQTCSMFILRLWRLKSVSHLPKTQEHLSQAVYQRTT